jgi:hypothetical protein
LSWRAWVSGRYYRKKVDEAECVGMPVSNDDCYSLSYLID